MELAEFNEKHNHKCSEERKYKAPKEPAVLAALEDFKDKKFGLMMHWGLSSQFDSFESWALPDQDRSWAWSNLDEYKDMSCSDFRKMYWDKKKDFNPTAMDPDKWAKEAKNAGFKYFLFTTKHHDGFCLWDTKYTDFKVTASDCPFHTNKNADICKALFDAFRKQDINVHAYFSKPDWHSEFYWIKDSRKGDYKTRMPNYSVFFNRKIWKKFVEYTANQMTEIVSNYGKIDCLWLDGGQVCPARGMNLGLSDIAKKLRAIQPSLMIVDRTVGGINENFLTPEQTVPDHVINAPWESCITLGRAFSYRKNDEFKDARQIIHLLCNIVAKGGNLALNIGPDINGNIPDEVYDILHSIGKWLDKNGFAIYATRPQAPHLDNKVVYTTKANEVFAIYLADKDEVLSGKLQLKYAKVANEVIFNNKKLAFTQSNDTILVDLAQVVDSANKDTDLAYVFTIK
ncbi:MAG: alpha-L-fucosidase [Clostridia bacterium]